MSYYNKSRGYSLERRVKLAFDEAGYTAKNARKKIESIIDGIEYTTTPANHL